MKCCRILNKYSQYTLTLGSKELYRVVSLLLLISWCPSLQNVYFHHQAMLVETLDIGTCSSDRRPQCLSLVPVVINLVDGIALCEKKTMSARLSKFGRLLGWHHVSSYLVEKKYDVESIMPIVDYSSDTWNWLMYRLWSAYDSMLWMPWWSEIEITYSSPIVRTSWSPFLANGSVLYSSMHHVHYVNMYFMLTAITFMPIHRLSPSIHLYIKPVANWTPCKHTTNIL